MHTQPYTNPYYGALQNQQEVQEVNRYPAYPPPLSNNPLQDLENRDDKDFWGDHEDNADPIATNRSCPTISRYQRDQDIITIDGTQNFQAQTVNDKSPNYLPFNDNWK